MLSFSAWRTTMNVVVVSLMSAGIVVVSYMYTVSFTVTVSVLVCVFVQLHMAAINARDNNKRRII